VENLISEFAFFFDRLNWLSVVDLLIVTLIAFLLLRLIRGTQAVVLLRGMIFLIILVTLLTTLLDLPAFSWLLKTAVPALLVAIPVIFAPEIRRALERLGTAGSMTFVTSNPDRIERMIDTICTTTQRLADQKYGALIVIERDARLDEYLETGVRLDANLTPQLLLQIFFTNTPLHDGAAIIRGDRIIAAACVMPLSASGTLSSSPERHIGLRHRAALGISEVSDSVAVVVSEETGGISVTHNGRMIRRLDQSRLRNILNAFFRPRMTGRLPDWFEQLLVRWSRSRDQVIGD
jgi:diadenylate cyclase